MAVPLILCSHYSLYDLVFRRKHTNTSETPSTLWRVSILQFKRRKIDSSNNYGMQMKLASQIDFASRLATNKLAELKRTGTMQRQWLDYVMLKK